MPELARQASTFRVCGVFVGGGGGGVNATGERRLFLDGCGVVCDETVVGDRDAVEDDSRFATFVLGGSFLPGFFFAAVVVD